MKVHPDTAVSQLLGVARTIRKMRHFAQNARSKRAHRRGWGLASSDRPLLLSVASASVLCVCATYGAYKYARGYYVAGASAASFALSLLLRPWAYEVYQLAVTTVGIASWSLAIHNIALIDIPGDPMHLTYVFWGHSNYSREQPWNDDNPLGVERVRVEIFHSIEWFYFCCIALSSVFNAIVRLRKTRTRFQPKLWLLLDAIELGCMATLVLKAKVYSPYIIGGVFRFVRCLRFERMTYSLFAREGLFHLNGVLVRYYLLLLKLGVGLAAFGALMCAVEYPCAPLAIRRNDMTQLNDCNDWFKRYDQCLYFLVITLATIGYGDMYPATIQGRIVMILLLLFVLAMFPALAAHLHELADGDDMSQEDYIISCVVAVWEEATHVNLKLNDIMPKLKSATIAATALAEAYNKPSKTTTDILALLDAYE